MGNQVSLKLQRDEDGLPTLDELGGAWAWASWL